MKRVFILSAVFLLGVNFAYGEIPSEEEVRKRLKEYAQLYFKGSSAAALEKYKTLSKETADKDAFLNAAFIATELGKPKESVDIMTAAYKYFPEDTLVREFLGESYLLDGQFINAERIFTSILNTPAKQDFYYTLLARAQLGQGDVKKAEENFKKAAEGKAQRAFASYMLGSIYQSQKKYKSAASAFENAVNYDHQFFEARLGYAYNLYKINNYNEAWRQYRMVYQVYKDDSIKKIMESLEPKLTKKQSEILNAKVLSAHTYVKKYLFSDESQTLKIGLAVNVNGTPAERTALTFIPSNNFKIINTATKEEILSGKAKEAWRAILEKNTAYIVDPEEKKTKFTGSVMIVQDDNTEYLDNTVILKEMESGTGMTWASSDDKEYRGIIEIKHDTRLKRLIPINHVHAEEYLFGVISSEMPTAFPMEALKAQAVLARTYAMYHKGKHKKYGYDLCDAQNCQVYNGVSAESEKGNAAIEATEGMILTYKGRPIESVFSGNTGGITQNAEDAGWNKKDYLTSRSDYKDFDFSNIQPYNFKELLQHPQDAYSNYDKHVSPAAFRWFRVVDVETVAELAKKRNKNIGDIVAIIPEVRAESGYVGRVKIKGTKGEVILKGEGLIKRNLSRGLLRSTSFIVQPVYEKKKLKEFVFFGGGWGHGVGFDQTGAAGRAEDGQSYDVILKHYFPVTTLESTVKEAL
ncbi:SpoIID/LytB domain protein [Parelusimicrobium proximum]|uniref:SpoIID/LytB domain-containing protein n=1 Tax=Parelusimicrobium proximum TaxID=3228953 RepID=UPI003D173934